MIRGIYSKILVVQILSTVVGSLALTVDSAIIGNFLGPNSLSAYVTQNRPGPCHKKALSPVTKSTFP